MKQLHPEADDATVVKELVSDWINRVPALCIAAGHASRHTLPAPSASSETATEHSRLPAEPGGPLARKSLPSAQTHCYLFAAAHPPGTPVIHGLDCPYAFGNLTAKMMGRQMLGPAPPAECYALSEAMQTAWVSFCRCGDPQWGCPGFTTHVPVQRVWSLPDVWGKHQPAPLAEQAAVWEGLSFGAHQATSHDT